ncbi:hypothetical protein Ancab_038229 [Ancistrocladus abbreviatus]
MARWDEILSLPVQNPPTLEFSSSDLVWSKVGGWCDKVDRVALIPFARVDDFVRGESSNKDCPTRFHVEARRRRHPQAPYKPKVDGILEYILYWCSFGPDDHRRGGVVRPSRNTYIRKKKPAGRPNTKRGCTCRFIVKRLMAEPSVALIIYNQDKHVDSNGLPCHGPQDKKAAGTRAMYAPYISEDLRLRVLSLLYVGVSVETIMQRHNESVERQGGPCNRDDLLTHRYVRRQERSIRRSTFEQDQDDVVSLSMWVERHQSHVFFYDDFSDSVPFTVGIQTEWQLQQMIHFGNRSLLISDSRFGANKLKYPIHSLLAFNSENKAIPVAWVISPRFASGDAYRWMRALYNRVKTKDPAWKLAGFVVDDPLADVLAIRDVFQCPVLISLWRIRHAWHKNLVKRCPSTEMQVQISRQLGQAISDICRGHGTVGLFDHIMEDFVDVLNFVEYFKAIWYPRIGFWTIALQTLPLASLETCAVVEFYHNQLKGRLLDEKDTSVYQRVDWLVDKLATKVHSYFWLDEYPGKEDFARYWKKEWVSGLTSFRRAFKIPDADVTFKGQCAKVVDQHDQNKTYVVVNHPGSEFAICDCSLSQSGNLCEHVFKVMKICRSMGSAKPSISLHEYRQALIKMLHCPPHDSMVRDQAVSMAVLVQKQLNAFAGIERNDSLKIFMEQQSGDSASDENGALVDQNQCTPEVALFGDGNSHGSCQVSANGAAGEFDDRLIDQTGNETVVCGENALSCDEMNVDPLSICVSPSGSPAVDGALPTDLWRNRGTNLVDIDHSLNCNNSPKNDALKSRKRFEHETSDHSSYEHLIDGKAQSVDLHVSKVKFLGPDTGFHGNRSSKFITYQRKKKRIMLNKVDVIDAKVGNGICWKGGSKGLKEVSRVDDS